MSRRYIYHFGVFFIWAFLLSFILYSPAQAQPTGYQEYYVLGYEEHVWRAFLGIYDGPDSDIPAHICSTVSLVGTADYQTIYYDHWEDGYEADIFNHVQPTTEEYDLAVGQHLSLTSDEDSGPAINQYVPVPRDPTDIRYDGGDRIFSSGGPVDVTHAMWPWANSWVGGAWEIYSRQSYTEAYSYRLPIGEDLYYAGGGDDGSYGDLRNVYLELQAFEDNTTVLIDNGQDELNLTLDRGQTFSSLGYINSNPATAITINSGAVIQSNKPTQVGLIAGSDSPQSTFQGRFLIVLPDLLWGGDYIVPVPSGSPTEHDGDEAEIYLSNPNDFAITVQAHDIETHTTFILSPTHTIPYSLERGALGYVPQDSAARFTSDDGVFGVVVCADTSDTQYDWGFSGIASRYLSRDYYVSWAPGMAGADPWDNGSPVWVTPLANDTTFYVDYSPLDGWTDEIFSLDVLQQRRIFDPDNDNTGMHVWATGEFAAAWGQDPRSASPLSSYLDMGVAMLPLDRRWLDAVMTLDKTADPTILPISGGVVTFTLLVESYDIPLADVNVSDTLPPGWYYLPGSTLVVYPDGDTNDPDPEITGQDLLWALSTHLDLYQSLTLTFQAQLDDTGGAALTAFDGFESNDYSGGSNWAGDWQEVGDDGDPASGGVRIIDWDQPFDDHQLLLGNVPSTQTLAITRPVDLSHFSAPVLRFARRIVDLEANDYFYLEVYDGDQWHTLFSWSDGDQENIYVQQAIDLGPYADANSAIRFRSSDIYDQDLLYLDEIKIYEGRSMSVNRGKAIGRHSYSNATFNPTDEAIVYISPLSLSKTVSSPTAQIGDTLVYTLYYANASDSLVVDNVLLRDTVPIQYVEFLTASDGGAYHSASGAITWTLDALEPGESGFVTFAIKVNDFVDDGTVIENVGYIDGDQTISVGSNIVRTNVLAPKVLFQKSGPTVAGVGHVITYTLAYQNDGGIQSSEVLVWDEIPLGTMFTSGSLAIMTDTQWLPLSDQPGDDQGAFISPTVIITPGVNPGMLAAGESGQIRFSVRVHDDVLSGARVLNTATLDRALDAPRESNMVVTRISDLLISKASSQAVTAPNNVITYMLTYTNDSLNIPQTNVFVREPIPDYTRLISDSVYGADEVEYSWDNGASWTNTLPITPVTHLRWYDAELPPDAQAYVGFAVQVHNSLPESTTIRNIAHIISSETVAYIPEWIPSNEVEIETVNLWLIKTADRPIAWNGETLTFTIAFGNHGTAGVANVLLLDTTPISNTYVPGSIWGPGADDSNAPDLRWQLGSLTPDASGQAGFQIKIGDDLARRYELTNTATISSVYGQIESEQAMTIINQFSMISGTVFNDLDGNGAQDLGELGIPSVTLALDDQFSATTNISGNYMLSATLMGYHTIVETDPPGYFSTTPNTVTLHTALNTDYVVNFGDALTDSAQFASIHGTVFEDLDGNGQKGWDEGGIPDVLVTLDGISATLTDDYGNYSFATAITGAHSLVETDPDGYFSTTPNTLTLNVVWGRGYVVNFGDAPDGLDFATIYGLVFEDLDGNGAQDVGERGLSGVTITFDEAFSLTTRAYGVYAFASADASVHSIVENDPPGYFSTTPNTVTLQTELGQGYPVYFGDAPIGSGFAAIYGTVFGDWNGDGIWDIDESGIPDVLITLETPSATVAAHTNPYGAFAFSTTISGMHTLTETDPPYYLSTTPNSVTLDVTLDSAYAVNFGDQGQAIIHGVVFADLNGNGLQDSSETGIAGAPIVLDAGEQVTTTNASGHYTFATLSGIHTIVESDLAGYFSTTPNTITIKLDTSQRYQVNFGDAPVGSGFAAIYGTVFQDLDGDGRQDPTELGLSNALLILKTAHTTISARTNLNGCYTFSSTLAGMHTVIETDPAGYFSTTPNQVRVSVSLGAGYAVDFGDALNDSGFAAIYGVVFEDINGNGAQDANEAGIRGAPLNLDAGSTLTSDVYGRYTFSVTQPGLHTLVASDLPGYFSTTPNWLNIDVSLGADYPVDFGDALQGVGFAAVYGVVFEDLDGDGAQDDGESGIHGVRVSLDGLDASTNLYGGYTLSTSVPGQHALAESTPEGYFSTTPDHLTLDIVLDQGYLVSFGDAPIGSDFAIIQGAVFADVNGSGRLDPGELGISGVLITLNSSVTTTTDASGNYVFAVLTGTHTVVESDPDGYFSTTPNTITVDVEWGDGYIINFGDAPFGIGFASVYGRVFEDINGDGEQSAGEIGIPNVLVTLDGITTTHTNANGYYLFVTSAAGIHTLVEADPPGYFSTTPNEMQVLVNLGDAYRIDFGDAPETLDWAAVYGLVFQDDNLNGQRDLGEVGIPDVLLTLLMPDTSITTTTRPDGSYLFSTTLNGMHTLIETNPPGYLSTNPDQANVDIELGHSQRVDFGDVAPPPDASLVNGLVFEDPNGNGEQDQCERGIPDVLLTLQAPSATLTTTTDFYGRYHFVANATGLHEIIETDPPNYFSTTSNQVPLNITDFGRQYIVNFGDVPSGTVTSAIVQGVVFYDANQNGQRDLGEVGIRQVIINLDNEHTDVTDDFGRYIFTTTVVGFHTVCESDLDGYQSTTPNTITLYTEWGNIYSLDFGDIPDEGDTAHVFGVVFADLDGNGKQGDEAGIPNAPVALQTPSTVLTTTTGPYGSFAFATIESGLHILAETDPPGYFSTTPNTLTLNFTLGNDYRLNFGDAPRDVGFAALYGFVYEDSNNNQSKDVKELVIPSVVLSLDGVLSSTTNALGYYLFTSADPGAHTVVESDPPGYISTTPNQVLLQVSVNQGYQVDFGDVVSCTCPPDAYEPDDGPALAVSLTVGLSQAHDFCDDTADWVAFDAQAGVVYSITTSSWGLRADTSLTLFAADGQTRLAANDDCPGSSDFSSCISWQAHADGLYYIRTNNRAALFGCYTNYDLRLQVQERYVVYLPAVKRGYGAAPDQLYITSSQSILAPSGVISHTCPDAYEVDDNWQQARPIEVGLGQVHSFDSDTRFYAADKDFVSFNLVNTNTITFSVYRVSNTLLLSDSVLVELYDQRGVALNVTGTGQLVWSPVAPGAYYACASPRRPDFGCADTAGYYLWLDVTPSYLLYLPVVMRGYSR